VIAPGVVCRVDGTYPVTVGLNQVADRINEGLGLMNNGSLAIDTAAPSGSLYDRGMRQNSSGALFGTTTVSGSDIFIEGVRFTSGGVLVYQLATPDTFVNGNPIKTNGALAVS